MVFYLREYVIPGVVFFTMIRWLIINVVAPSLSLGIFPERTGNNEATDIDLIAARWKEEEEQTSEQMEQTADKKKLRSVTPRVPSEAKAKKKQ